MCTYKLTKYHSPWNCMKLCEVTLHGSSADFGFAAVVWGAEAAEAQWAYATHQFSSRPVWMVSLQRLMARLISWCLDGLVRFNDSQWEKIRCFKIHHDSSRFCTSHVTGWSPSESVSLTFLTGNYQRVAVPLVLVQEWVSLHSAGGWRRRIPRVHGVSGCPGHGQEDLWISEGHGGKALQGKALQGQASCNGLQWHACLFAFSWSSRWDKFQGST